MVQRIESFVRKVAKFKGLAVNGELETPEFRRQLEEFDRFKPEFSGRRRGRRAGAFDYFSYNGDIVKALYDDLNETKGADEEIYNTQLIDLYVKRRNKIIEIYEVKTGTDRQDIYTAIGQLMVHSQGDDNIEKFMVLPGEETLPNDVMVSLDTIGIGLWRFTLTEDGSVTLNKI
jgi:hypothetical protein